MSADERRAAVERIEWYHTLELPNGVRTPGWFDLAGIIERVPLPDSLEGMRCLDVGSFDGFWAFELERRGAAETIAIDVLDPRRWDWPAGAEDEVVAAIGRRKGRGEGFLLAREALGSSVERRELSVHELDPGEIGEFDLVYVGSLLLHLRDPIGALMRVRSVCREQLVLVDAVDLMRSLVNRRRPRATLDGRGRPWWWKPNVAGLARMVEAAGFRLTASPELIFMPRGSAQPAPRFDPRMPFSGSGWENLALRFRGDPHAAIHAEPV